MKKIGLVLGTCIALALVADATVVTFRNGVDGYTGTDDTTLDNEKQTRNSGARIYTTVNEKPDYDPFRKGLIRFDLTSLTDSLGSGESIQINSASLWSRITSIDGGSAGNQQVHLYAVSAANADWIEGNKTDLLPADAGEATWAVKYHTGTHWAGSPGLSTPGTDYNATVAGSFDVDMGAGTTDQRLTATLSASVVQGWVDDASSNGGFLMDMVAPKAGFVTFYSSDATDVNTRPELTIDYTVVEKVSISLIIISSVD